MILKRKNKDYLVTIITKTSSESMTLKAKSKRQAKKLVRSVVINCSLYPFKRKKDFRLKCKEIKINTAI